MDFVYFCCYNDYKNVLKYRSNMNYKDSIYFNKLEIRSNDFNISKIKHEKLSEKLKKLSNIYLDFRLSSWIETEPCNIYLSFNPQVFYNQNQYEYKTIVEYKKLKKCISNIQKCLQYSYIEPMERWSLVGIEISKDMKLNLPYLHYIDIIKLINPQRKGVYSVVTDHDDGRIIYFSTPLRKNINYSKTHIRFENKIRTAKLYKQDDGEFQELKENILQCTIMLKEDRIAPFVKNERVSYMPIFLRFLDRHQNNLSCISDDHNLTQCKNYLVYMLDKYLLSEDFKPYPLAIKDDTKLMDKIIEKIKSSDEKSILYFIITKLLSENPNCSVAKIFNFLSKHPKQNIRKIRLKVRKNIDYYRNTYRINFKEYSSEDLYMEIKDKLYTKEDLDGVKLRLDNLSMI